MQQRRQRPGIHGDEVSLTTRSGKIQALIYNEENRHPGYVIVEVHGGGFMYNTAWDDDDFCAAIHHMTGIPVVACNYRLAPDYPFPTGLEDVYDCVTAVLEMPELKAQKDRVILWGHSAGANLVAGAVYQAKEKQTDFKTNLMILDYPYMDAFRQSKDRARIRGAVSGKLMDTFAHYYTRDTSLTNPLISPVYMHPKQLEGMPKTFLLLCGRDNLNAGGKEYGKRLKAAGVPVTFHYVRDALHGFIENHYNYENISRMTQLQLCKAQRQLAEYTVPNIVAWIEKNII